VLCFSQGKRRLVHFAIDGVPHDSDDDPEQTHGDEHPAPAEGDHQDRQQRRRDGRAERRGAVPDPCGQSAVSHIPPVAHDTRRAGKHRCLAGTEEDAGDNELPEVPDQTSRRLGKRPDEQAEAQQAARTKAVGQRSARKLAESVSPEECGEQKPHVGDRQAELFTDQRIGDGERSTVDIVERSSDHQK
jgi:hypothetical protein